ncbi:KUP/HAK/KT family potassium transporter [Paraburkholderia bryophila]|uniref:KUP/HAK/KT family potassium transporter n=1 Tax=Paraburkholderia bryophila TaxID=420952 RepID=UPI003AF0263B
MPTSFAGCGRKRRPTLSRLRVLAKGATLGLDVLRSRPAQAKSWPLGREKLFAFLARNAAQAADYYGLPANRVVGIGGRINF